MARFVGDGRVLVPSLTSGPTSIRGSYSVIGGTLPDIAPDLDDEQPVRIQLMMTGDTPQSSLCIRRLKLRLYSEEGSLRHGLNLIKHAQQRQPRAS